MFLKHVSKIVKPFLTHTKIAAFASCMFLSFNATSQVLSGPDTDRDGSFEVNWDLSGNWSTCYNLSLDISSENGYSTTEFPERGAHNYSFSNLPEGLYTIELNGNCKIRKSGELSYEFEGFLGTIDISVSSQGRNATKPVLKVNLENLILDQQSKQLGILNSTIQAECKKSCSSGYHSWFMACDVRCGSNNCNPHNSVSCSKNTDRFFTCDQWCPSGYTKVGAEDGNNLNCNRNANREHPKIECVIQKPPRPTITSSSTTTSSSYTLRWTSASRASYYQWRKGGSWNNNGSSRSANFNNLSEGNHNFQVRACNTTGCSSAASKTVNVDLPAQFPPMSGAVIRYYDDDEGEHVNKNVQFYSNSAPSNYLYQFNTADGDWDWITFSKASDVKVRAEYSRTGNNGWRHSNTFPASPNQVQLCITNGGGSIVPAHCKSFPRYSSGLLYYRFRVEKNGDIGGWQYMRPIKLFRDS